MKIAGILLIIIGICAGAYTLNIDTSIEVSSQYTGTERVNNLGKMNDKQNYLFVSGIIFIAGVILLMGDREDITDELYAIKKTLEK